MRRPEAPQDPNIPLNLRVSAVCPNVVGQVVEMPPVLPKEPRWRLHLPSTVDPAPVKACVAELRKHPCRGLLAGRVVFAAEARGAGHGRCPLPVLAGVHALPEGSAFAGGFDPLGVGHLVLWFLGTTGHVVAS